MSLSSPALTAVLTGALFGAMWAQGSALAQALLESTLPRRASTASKVTMTLGASHQSAGHLVHEAENGTLLVRSLCFPAVGRGCLLLGLGVLCNFVDKNWTHRKISLPATSSRAAFVPGLCRPGSGGGVSGTYRPRCSRAASRSRASSKPCRLSECHASPTRSPLFRSPTLAAGLRAANNMRLLSEIPPGTSVVMSRAGPTSLTDKPSHRRPSSGCLPSNLRQHGAGARKTIAFGFCLSRAPEPALCLLLHRLQWLAKRLVRPAGRPGRWCFEHDLPR